MVVLVLVMAGCSTPMAQLRKEVGPRASDYLECPQDKLEYEELDKLISTTRVKVSGCKREVTYKLVESAWTRAKDGEPVR